MSATERPAASPQTHLPALRDTAHLLFADGKGLIAMDESLSTCHQRFAAAGIAQTEEMRRAYRELIVTTPGLAQAVSGAILFDETLHQRTHDGVPFVDILQRAGIVPGIKVDAGATPMALHQGEKITEGLDGLRERLVAYAALGARFAKWRAVIVIGPDLPSGGCIEANAHALARYAALCQDVGLVPIVEPEVLADGAHTLARCADVTERVQRALFDQLARQGVALEGLILKPNMVTAGLACVDQPTVDEVADATLRCLLRTVPAAVPGVAFLSGGQSGELASARLNAMHLRKAAPLPWALTFSYSRALQYPALGIWGGRPERVAAAQQALLHRAHCNHAAVGGTYTSAMEST